MRRVRNLLGLHAALLLGVFGCANTDHMKPPKQPEQYTLPPESDARFAQPIAYPKNSMFQDPLQRAAANDPGLPGAGPGAKGPGGAGMR